MKKQATAKIHVDISADLKRNLKMIAVKKGEKLRDIITNLVVEYLKKNNC